MDKRHYFVLKCGANINDSEMIGVFPAYTKAIDHAERMSKGDGGVYFVTMEAGMARDSSTEYRSFGEYSIKPLEQPGIPDDIEAERLAKKISRYIAQRNLEKITIGVVTRNYNSVNRHLAGLALKNLCEKDVLSRVVWSPSSGGGRPADGYLVNQEILNEYNN